VLSMLSVGLPYDRRSRTITWRTQWLAEKDFHSIRSSCLAAPTAELMEDEHGDAIDLMNQTDLPQFPLQLRDGLFNTFNEFYPHYARQIGVYRGATFAKDADA
jgi:hypothetical protein